MNRDRPSPGTYDCIRIAVVDDDWIDILSKYPRFRIFEDQHRVSILDYEVWVYEDDKEIINYLKELGILDYCEL